MKDTEIELIIKMHSEYGESWKSIQDTFRNVLHKFITKKQIMNVINGVPTQQPTRRYTDREWSKW